jgi:hypothetical protein
MNELAPHNKNGNEESMPGMDKLSSIINRMHMELGRLNCV